MSNPTPKATILLVEDDPTLGFVIKDNLEVHGYEVIHTKYGESAFQQFMKHNFDLCITDVMLPKKDGKWLASEIRKKNTKIPILMLTGKTLDEDKLAGFESGVDDYITKPFNMQELVMRMEVFLRRTKIQTEETPDLIKIGNLDFDFHNLTLSKEDNVHHLTQREAELLRYLALNPNRILKREEILLNVWGKEDYFLGRSMDVFITKIRKHLKPLEDVELQTIHGIGFRFKTTE